MDLTTQIQTISEDALDNLFNSQITPPADPAAPADGTPAPTDAKPEPDKQTSSHIPEIDIKDVKVEDATEGGEPAAAAPADGDPAKEPTDVPTEEINKVLKSTIDYLVDKGIFKDFEDRDKLEVDDNVYADLVAKQVDDKVSDLFDELIDSTGDYGKVIINHIKNGGNPDEVIDLFKEQKQVENFDISDARGQGSLIKKYYSEVIGWKADKIEKYLKTLESSEEGLEDEAKDVQSKYDEIYQKQLESLKTEQEEFTKKQKEAITTRRKEQQEYLNKLVTTIDTDKVMTDKDKKLIKDSMLKFNKKLDDGTPINDFFNKFYEIQKDPAQYVKLVHFVMDMEGYDTRVKAAKESDEVKKKWEFVSKNNAVSKSSGAAPDSKPKDKKPEINFSGYLKK